MNPTDIPFLDRLSSYDYELPSSLIAQYPVEPRDQSRLLVVHRASGKLEHRRFYELPALLSSGDLCVANNSKVIRARLLGKRSTTPGKVEFLLLEQKGPLLWEGLFHASAKYKPGVEFEIPTPDGKGLHAMLTRGAAESPHGTVEAVFDRDPLSCGAGEYPLPHYIDRHVEEKDAATYQTTYAREDGSAAAPTAGLHFTSQVLATLKERGIGWEEVTLHVGLGTFRPVKAENIRDHQMHEERYFIEKDAAKRLNQALGEKKRILAVGTTSVRTLESAARLGTEGYFLRTGEGRTNIFISPGYSFKAVGALLTNFHLPKSSLLMLVSAFAGRDLVMTAYEEAVREKYRFFSYGDAMLII